MRFQRHEESINPIWVKAWQGHRLPDPGATACGGRVRGHDPRSPSAPRHRARPGCRNVSGGARPAHRLDEFHRLFLDRDARQQSPSPLYRHAQNNSIAEVEKTIYHRTVTSVLTGCLTRGGHPTVSRRLGGMFGSIRHPHRYDLVAVPPVDTEIGVQRENFGCRVDFGESNQTGIGQRHGPIAIAPHKHSEVRLLLLKGERDANHPPIQQCKESIGVAALPFQEKGRLGKDGLARQ